VDEAIAPYPLPWWLLVSLASLNVSQRQLNQSGSHRPNVRKHLYVIGETPLDKLWRYRREREEKLDKELAEKLPPVCENIVQSVTHTFQRDSKSKANGLGHVLTDATLIRPTSSEPNRERNPRPL
jgi:hypothetical protein